MILTASKFVNARIGSPSTSANNPAFLQPGDKINIVSKVIGEIIEGNDKWLLSDSDQFFWSGGFDQTDFIKNIEYYANVAPPLFKELGISKLWDISRGEGMKVGIIDGGVQKNHPSLRGKVIELNSHQGLRIEDQLHATSMACIIGSLDLNGEIGIAPLIDNIYSYAVDVNNSEQVLTDALVEGLKHMEKNEVKIINISLTQHQLYEPSHPPDKLELKINELEDRGYVIICASGNKGKRSKKYYPAGFDNTLSVSCYRDNFLEILSNSWVGINVALPAQNYFTTIPLDKFSNSTSGGTAILSGCIACVYPYLKASQLSELKTIFESFERITYENGKNTHINIPKFNLIQFINHLNNILS